MSERPLVVRKRGRGGDRRHVTAAGLERIEALAAEGAVDTDIARRLGLTKWTFGRARERQEEIEQALAAGRAKLESEMADILISRARDKKDPASMTALIFLLKSRYQWDDRGAAPPPSVVVSGDSVKVEVAPRLSDEQFKALLERREPARVER